MKRFKFRSMILFLLLSSFCNEAASFGLAVSKISPSRGGRPSKKSEMSRRPFILERHEFGTTNGALLLPATARKDGSGDEEEEMDESMRKAFKSLESLSSDDIGEVDSVIPDSSLFAGKIKELEDSADLLRDDTPPSAGSTEEIKLYKEMYNEMSKGEATMYGNVMDDLSTDEEEVADTPSIIQEGLEICEDEKEQFMNRAIDEALKQIKSTIPEEISSTPETDPTSIRNDPELMSKINDIFDDATKQLKESVEEMRKEQEATSQQNKEARVAQLKEDEERLAEAEGSVSNLIANVNKEAEEVQKAMKELEQAKSKLGKDPLLQVAGFRNLGLVKQSALAGLILFGFRSLAELPLIGQVDGNSHLTLALVQFAIAVLCALVFFFL